MKVHANLKVPVLGPIGLTTFLLGIGVALAAWPEMPTHKTYVMPAYFPKEGQADFASSGFSCGYVRERMESFYEGWWKETSYYRANPTNGLNVRGYFMDTKTAGEVAAPWAWGLGHAILGESNVVGAVIGTAVTGITNVYRGTFDPKPLGGRPLTIRIGSRFLTDTTGGGQLTGDGVGSVNHSTGVYSFQLNVAAPAGTQIKAYYTCLAFFEGAVPSPASWANFSACIGDPGTDRFPDGQGEQFDELPDGLTPAVKYRRWDPVAGMLMDDPVMDGFWTPGERFTDRPSADGRTPPNNRWDPYIHAEDRWTPSHSITGNILLIDFYQNLVEFVRGQGDVYADYSLDTTVDTNVLPRVVGTVGMAESAVRLWIADTVTGTNKPYTINEMDLFPPEHCENGVPYYGVYYDRNQIDPDTGSPPLAVVITNNPGVELQGDASHTYVRDNTAPPPNLRPMYANIPALKRFEYEAGADGQPWVFQAPTNQYYVDVYTYTHPTIISNVINNPGVEYAGFVLDDSGFIEWVGQGSPWSLVYTHTNPIPLSLRVLCRIRVPIYYARPLWGAPVDAVNYLTPIGAGFFTVLNRFADAVSEDDQWTAAIPEEFCSDFISWWDPKGGSSGTGLWVPGLVGTPRGTLPAGSTPTPDYWSYERYCKYIRDNYPGDAEGLIARCGNDKYDGPENWAEVDNNQYMQHGFLATPVTALGEGWSGWDFSVGSTAIGSYNDWWANKFNTTPVFDSRIPNMVEWKPELTDENQGVPSTTVTNVTPTGTVVTVIYGEVTHPPFGTTWTYDSPREFYDMASSMTHNPDLGSSSAMQMKYNVPSTRDVNPAAIDYGGDLRLGEVTSPWNDSIWGQDRGDCNPGTPDYAPNGVVPIGGPYAYNTHANYGYDAANQLSLEFATHRTDGNSLTGPRGGSNKGAGYDWHHVTHVNRGSAVQYAKDHRDVNLNGLVDQGETVPAGSYNYCVDPVVSTIDNGMDTIPLFGWERFVEDCVETLDDVEDFWALSSFWPARTNAFELGIAQPGWYAWREGAVASNFLANVVGAQIAYVDSNADGQFTPGVDALWIDYNPNMAYDAMEPAIHNPVGNGAPTHGVAATAKWCDLDANAAYDIGTDLVWMDTTPGGAVGVFDSELVLHDASGRLAPGDGDAVPPITNLRTTRSIYVYPTVGVWQVMWAVTNEYVGPTDIYCGPNGVDLIYAAPGISFGWPGSMTGRLWNAVVEGVVRRVCRAPDDPGYMPGQDVFIDLNNNGVYDADIAVSVPLSGLLPVHAGLPQDGTLAIGYSTNGSDTAFHRPSCVAWLERNPPSDERNGDFVLFQTIALSNGTHAAGCVTNMMWIDLPGMSNILNGTFDPVHMVHVDGQDYDYCVGDALFYDANGNGVYDVGQRVSTPLYMVGLYNQTGVVTPATHAGNRYGVMTRQGYLSGYNQNQPTGANMPVPALLTHEQCHDVLGWPDLYDYDSYTQEVVNNPCANGDLMAIPGPMAHGYPDLKFKRNPAGASWGAFNGVTPQELNYGLGSILSRGGGQRTLLLYPVERYADQYYVFRNELNPVEYFTIHFNAGDLSGTTNPRHERPSQYANPIGRGVVIGHTDSTGATATGCPQQQRSNNRFRYLYVQADGMYHLEDGAGVVEPADAFGRTPTTRSFSSFTIPSAVWYDQADSGLRILDIRIPTDDPYAPAEVDVEWVASAEAQGSVWYWVPSGNDSDGDGIPDLWEYYWFGSSTNPLAEVSNLTDHDGDGLTDLQEWMAHENPLVSSTANDSDGDGLDDDIDPNPAAPNEDRDGVPTWVEIAWDGDAGTYNPYNPVTNPTGGDLNVDKADTDGDGVSDLEEIAAGSNPIDPASSNALQITGWETADGEMRVEWQVYSNVAGVPVTFYLEATANMVDWVKVGVYGSDGKTDETAVLRHPLLEAAVKGYRLRVAIE